MKISELISKLLTYNQNADITLTTSENITLSYICKDPNTNKELTPLTTRQVFIEPLDNCVECVHEYMKGELRWCSHYDKPCTNVDECYQFEEFDM